MARECISNKLRMVRGGRVGGADGAGREDGGRLCDRIAVGTTPSASARLKGRGGRRWPTCHLFSGSWLPLVSCGLQGASRAAEREL